MCHVSHCYHRHVRLSDTKSYAALLDDGLTATHTCLCLCIHALEKYSNGTLRQKRQLQQLYAPFLAHKYF